MGQATCHQSLNGAAYRACPGGLKPNRRLSVEPLEAHETPRDRTDGHPRL